MPNTTHKWTDQARADDAPSEWPAPRYRVVPESRPVRTFARRVLLPIFAGTVLFGLAAHKLARLFAG